MMPAVSELEQLGELLSILGLRTTLGPQEDGQLALDVIQADSMIRRAERVTWSGEWFTWASGERIAADVTAAVTQIMDRLSWRGYLRSMGLLAP